MAGKAWPEMFNNSPLRVKMGSLKGGNNVKTSIALIALLAVVCMAVGAHATEEYAARTNKSCEACHVDPAGGGTLTPEGQAFGQQLLQKTAYRPLAHLPQLQISE
jgi:hypothetical protein